MIYPYKNLSKTLFIDIETVSEYRMYDELDERMKALWHKKATSLSKTTEPSEEELDNLYRGKAAIYAEFSKVVCISCAHLKDDHIRLKSIYGDDEKELLEAFSNLLIQHYPNVNDYYLCGHNIKEFDIPFLCRRMVIHGVFMPNMLDLAGKKPWQTEHLIDTMDLWRFGDYKSYTSLDLLTAVLGIPTPKNDIDGSMVGKVYYEDHDLERIARYCEKDVVSLVQVMMKYCGKALVPEENIVIIK